MKTQTTSSPYFDFKQIDQSHMYWVRSVYVNPTPKQQLLLDWLLDTKVAIQRKYVILDDDLVESPTNVKRYQKKQQNWVQTYPLV